MTIAPCLRRNFTDPSGAILVGVRDDACVLFAGGEWQVRSLLTPDAVLTTSGFFVATCRVLCFPAPRFGKTCVPSLELRGITGRDVSTWTCRTNETMPTAEHAKTPFTHYDTDFWVFWVVWVGLCVLLARACSC